MKDSKRKPNKTWIHQGSEFYNNAFETWLGYGIEMFSTHNEGKSVIKTVRFIRTLRIKIYKHMTAVSKNIYIVQLDDNISKYNKTFDSALKANIDYRPKYKIGDHARIAKYKYTFGKFHTPNFLKKFLLLKKKKKILYHKHTL